MDYQYLKNLSVLVVDDEVELRELVAEEFKKTGARVEVAESGSDALIKVKEGQFDIVFTDIRMPRGDGFFLASEIQKLDRKNLYVFFYSGHCDLSIEELVPYNISGVFKKPQSLVNILESVDLFMKKVNS